MGSTKNTEPTYYNSRFRHGVDEKRRVQIPAKWRPQKPTGELTLILWPREGVGAVRAGVAAGADGEIDAVH